MEKWAEIARFPGYGFSNLGRISRVNISYGTSSGAKTKYRYLQGGRDRFGYLQTWVCHKKYYTHRLILEAFVGPCLPGKEGEHKNRIKDDNRLKNLWWATHSENMKNRGMTPKWRAVILKNLAKGRAVQASKRRFQKVMKELKWTHYQATREACLAR